jgi:DNA/RNA-binding domain of Phe-tRNA-synthetase-like protein
MPKVNWYCATARVFSATRQLDSARTCINPDTRNILAIFFTPAEIEQSYLDQTLAALAALYQQECPQCCIDKYIVKP